MAADVDGRVLSGGINFCDFNDLSQIQALESVPNGSINTMDDTFREYSPKNSQMVRVLTDISTPSRSSNVNSDGSILTCLIPRGARIHNRPRYLIFFLIINRFFQCWTRNL